MENHSPLWAAFVSAASRVTALAGLAAGLAGGAADSAAATGFEVQEFPVPAGSGVHDVAPAPDGTVWYTAQRKGALGRLNPADGHVREVPLGDSSAPHGVISGPDGNAWVTDGGQNAIVQVDAATHAVTVYPLPTRDYANLNTPVFDPAGVLWFTGQSGVWGRLVPQEGTVQVWPAPRGAGPYGITATPGGTVYYASLAGSYLGRVDAPGKITVLDPPTPRQGARRAWSDSRGRVWVSYWSAGRVGRYDPKTAAWREWKLPGKHPLPYAVYVDSEDKVWLSDWEANALVRFDPATERFDSVRLPSRNAGVRQIHGRPGEVWGAESGADKLVRVRTR
jgi:virginiamycin B lyase